MLSLRLPLRNLLLSFCVRAWVPWADVKAVSPLPPIVHAAHLLCCCVLQDAVLHHYAMVPSRLPGSCHWICRVYGRVRTGEAGLWEEQEGGQEAEQCAYVIWEEEGQGSHVTVRSHSCKKCGWLPHALLPREPCMLDAFC